jgi:hypothetical protein
MPGSVFSSAAEAVLISTSSVRCAAEPAAAGVLVAAGALGAGLAGTDFAGGVVVDVPVWATAGEMRAKHIRAAVTHRTLLNIYNLRVLLPAYIRQAAMKNLLRTRLHPAGIRADASIPYLLWRHAAMLDDILIAKLLAFTAHFRR